MASHTSGKTPDIPKLNEEEIKILKLLDMASVRTSRLIVPLHSIVDFIGDMHNSEDTLRAKNLLSHLIDVKVARRTKIEVVPPLSLVENYSMNTYEVDAYVRTKWGGEVLAVYEKATALRSGSTEQPPTEY